MVIGQGDIWWAEFPPNGDSGAAYTRPVVVVQSDHVNRSSIRTVLCVPLTTTLDYAEAQGNVLLRAEETGLPKDSVATAPHLAALHRRRLRGRIGKLAPETLHLVFGAVDAAMDR